VYLPTRPWRSRFTGNPRVLKTRSEVFTIDELVIKPCTLTAALASGRALWMCPPFSTCVHSCSFNQSFVLELDYYGRVGIGAPRTPSNLILSSSVAGMEVITTECLTCLPEMPKPNPSRSTTFASGTPINFIYGSDSASGRQALDTVGISGLSVAQKTFGTILAMSPHSLMSSPYLLREVAITNVTSGFLSAPASGIGFQSVDLTQARSFVHSLLSSSRWSCHSSSQGRTTQIRPLKNPAVPSRWVERIKICTRARLSTCRSYRQMHQDIGRSPSLVGPPNIVPLVRRLMIVTELTVNGRTIATSTGDRSHALVGAGAGVIGRLEPQSSASSLPKLHSGGPTTDVRNFWATVPGSQLYKSQAPGYTHTVCPSHFSLFPVSYLFPDHSM
jgi:hypothetical protein